MSAGRSAGRAARVVRGRLSRLVTDPRFPILLAAAATGISILVFHLVYPDLSWNRDEPVFLWQADLLLDGQLTQSDGGFPAQFHPWLSAHHAGRFFGQYPLGWPVLIAIGKLIGFPAFAPALGSVIFVLGGRELAHELTRSRARANTVGMMLLLSPILVVQSGVYLNYLFTAGLGAFFTTLVLRSVRTGSRSAAAGAGVLLGMVFLTRTYDAAVWGTVVGGFVLIADRERWRDLLRLLPPFLIALLPALAIQALHNLATTGSVTAFALSVADPLDRFGFGPRRMMPLQDLYEHTAGGALRDSAKHLFFLPWFLFGAHLTLAAAVLGAWRTRSGRNGALLIALCIAFPVAYLPFWGIHISSLTTRISGPIYYVPMYIPLCILAVEGLLAMPQRRRGLLRAGTLVAVLATTVIGVSRLGVNRHLSRMQAVWHAAVADLEDSVVVVSPSDYLLFPDPNSMTRPDHPDGPVYTTDVDPGLIELIDRSGRPAVMITPDVPIGELAPSEHTERFEVIRHDALITRGPAVTLTIEIRTVSDQVATVDLSVDGDTTELTAVEAGGEPPHTPVRVVLGGDEAAAGPGGFVIEDATVIDIVIGGGPDEKTARAQPVVRHRLLVDRDEHGEVRLLMPGRVYRPVEKKLAAGEVVWLEHVDEGDVVLTARRGALDD